MSRRSPPGYDKPSYLDWPGRCLSHDFFGQSLPGFRHLVWVGSVTCQPDPMPVVCWLCPSTPRVWLLLASRLGRALLGSRTLVVSRFRYFRALSVSWLRRALRRFRTKGVSRFRKSRTLVVSRFRDAGGVRRRFRTLVVSRFWNLGALRTLHRDGRVLSPPEPLTRFRRT